MITIENVSIKCKKIVSLKFYRQYSGCATTVGFIFDVSPQYKIQDRKIILIYLLMTHTILICDIYQFFRVKFSGAPELPNMCKIILLLRFVFFVFFNMFRILMLI